MTLAGWVARRRDHGGVVFIDLRDASGSAQVVFREEDARARPARRVLREGRRRGPGAARGQREPRAAHRRDRGRRRHGRGAQRVRAAAVPDRGQRGRSPRRRGSSTATSTSAASRWPSAMRIRSKATYLANEVMHEHGFVYVETPTLTRSTPEGARDFLVPGPAAAGQLVRPAAVAAAVQAAAAWWPAWSATTSSPSASATRTCGPTGSRSSPRSTSRCPSSTRRTSSRSARR